MIRVHGTGCKVHGIRVGSAPVPYTLYPVPKRIEMLFTIFAGLGIGVSIGYAFLVYRFLYSWRQIPQSPIVFPEQAEWFFTIIVPMRNEAANIEACISSILHQQYPSDKYELIVIDDHSEDDSLAIAKKYEAANVRILSLPNMSTGKKAAIDYAIHRAKGEIIATTDADCEVQAEWLQCLAGMYRLDRSDFIAAPVMIDNPHGFLQKYQALDTSGMMLITAAGIYSKTVYMSNGANLAYPKQIFLKLRGFENIDFIASGDDIMLMHKVAAYKGKISFSKRQEGIVFTQPQASFRDLLRQKIRWASKSGHLTQDALRTTQALVFLSSASLILSFLFWPLYGIRAMVVTFSIFLVKSSIDYQILKEATAFFNNQKLMKIFIPAQLLGSLYVTIVGTASFFVKEHRWKGRVVK